MNEQEKKYITKSFRHTDKEQAEVEKAMEVLPVEKFSYFVRAALYLFLNLEKVEQYRWIKNEFYMDHTFSDSIPRYDREIFLSNMEDNKLVLHNSEQRQFTEKVLSSNS